MPKIFILDDDRISNELNKLVFKLMGITDIDIRTTGHDALLYFEDCIKENEFPDLMFIDLNLPGMSGFDFIEKYETLYKSYMPGRRIIMLTNSILEEDRDTAIKFDSVLDFLSKPLSRKILMEIFQKADVDFPADES